MPLTVDVTAISGTARPGEDFTATTQTLTFAAGETSKTVDVPVTGDNAAEEDEFFVVNLSNPRRRRRWARRGRRSCGSRPTATSTTCRRRSGRCC